MNQEDHPATLEPAKARPERPGDARLMTSLLLACAALVSATITVCFVWFGLDLLIVGGTFGALIALSLRRAHIFDSQQTGWFIVMTALAYALAAALVLKLAPLFSSPKAGRDAPIIYIAAGALGGLLVIGGAAWLAHRSSGSGSVSLVSRAVLGAFWGGLLAGAGWTLGPSLGSLASTIPNSLFNFLANPQEQDWLSLFIVWQTGMGFVLGLMLGGRQGAAREEEQR
jgi:hypothetical protein